MNARATDDKSWFRAAMGGVAVVSAIVFGPGLAMADGPAQAQQAVATTPAQALRTRTMQAYDALATYASQSKLTIFHMQDGQRKVLAEYAMSLAMDRPGRRWRSDRPDMQVALADGRLKLKTPQAPMFYLDVPGPAELTVASLLQALPYVDGAGMAEMALVLGDPRSLPAESAELPPDATGRPGLTFAHGPDASVTLRLDPQTHLVTLMQRSLMVRMRGQPEPVAVTLEWQFNPSVINQPLADSALAFDAGSAKVTDDLSVIFPHQPGIKAKSMQGKAAPAFSLQDTQGQAVTLASLQKKHRVVLLDFWATWCGPCRMSLPMLQRVQQWADEQGLPVAIYTVNQAETVPQVQAMWRELGLSLPVLMDSQAHVSGLYGAESLPTMFVLVDGVVRKVHLGVTPNYEQDVKDEILSLLKPVADAAALAH